VKDKTETPPPFWLVWNPGRRIPRFQHDSYNSARQEADRLAGQCPGEHFYVLCPVARCVGGKVTFEPYVSELEAQRLDGNLAANVAGYEEDEVL